jgi:hemoglobin/transferrin/lactoferrin receptor protein
MYSVAVDLARKFKKWELFYGLESYYENLNSSYSTNMNTGSKIQSVHDIPMESNVAKRYLYSYNDKIAENTFWNLGARVGNTSLKVPLLIILFFHYHFRK